MADEGYTTIFHPNNQGVTIHKEGTVKITTTTPADIQGWRAETGLWEFDPTENRSEPEKAPTAPTPTKNVCNVHSLPTIPTAIRFLHAAVGYPTKATWLEAIKKENFVTWPLLTPKNVNKHYLETAETDKGHMKKQRMNVRSTKVLEDKSQDEAQTPLPRKNDIYIHIFNFPVTSNRGNKYVMIMCEVDGNYIDMEPMKRRTSEALVHTYLTLWERLTRTKVITPKLHILDNEAPEALKDAMT